MKTGRSQSFIIGGLIGLPIGAWLTVDSASQIARMLGASETVIGLTIVAIGTSLPELVTSVMAAWRKSGAVMIGNVVGSNIFNIGLILGGTALVLPLDVDPRIVSIDMWVMLAAGLLVVALGALEPADQKSLAAWLCLRSLGPISSRCSKTNRSQQIWRARAGEDRMPSNGTVLVTGAGRRIGKAIATDLAAHGYHVAIHANHSGAEAEAVAASIRDAGGLARRFPRRSVRQHGGAPAA